MSDKLVTIAKFDSAFDAELAKAVLEDNGIKAAVVGGDLVANMPTIEPIKVELEVFEDDAERAKQLLEEAANQADNEEDYDTEED